MTIQPKTREFRTSSGHKIIYNKLSGDGNYYVFLGGLMSDRNGTKALFFEDYCRMHGFSYIRFDYLGHGESDLIFSECNIQTWLQNSCDIINNFTNGKVTIIGSSLGGWLMCLVAQKFPDKIKALIGIAAAPDFTENLMWNKFSDETKKLLSTGNIYNIPCDYDIQGYPITMDLIKSGRRNLILGSKSKLNINIPIKLFHGMEDQDVPYEYSINLAKKVTSDNVEVILIKNGDHRLSDEDSLKLISSKL